MCRENSPSNRKVINKSFAEMTAKEKNSYLAKRICKAILTVLFLALAVYLVCGYIISAATDTLLAGIAINVPLSEDGQVYLRDAYKDRISDDRLDKVYLNLIEMENVATDSNYDDNYYTLMTISSLNSNKELDYLLVDQVGLENLLRKNVFGDLRILFTPEELEAIGKDLIYIQQGENAEPIPIAVKVTDIPFIAQNAGDIEHNVFFGIGKGTPRLEQCRDLWEYLLEWQKNTA